MAVGPEQRLSPEERANLAAYIDGELTENEARVDLHKAVLQPNRPARSRVAEEDLGTAGVSAASQGFRGFPRSYNHLVTVARREAGVLGTSDLGMAWPGCQAGCLPGGRGRLDCRRVRADALGMARSGGPDGQGAFAGRASRGIPGSRLLRVSGGAGEVKGVRCPRSLRLPRVDLTANTPGSAPGHRRDPCADRSLDRGRRSTGRRTARLRSFSPQQRNEVSETLRRFDLQVSPEQQKAIRDLDQQIQKLPVEERAHYLAVLRRYHNWLDSLPETT